MVVQMGGRGISNLFLRNYFAIIDDGLKNRVSGKADSVLELQYHGKKLFMPPTTVGFDAIRPAELLVPTATLVNCYIE
jgi:hypothetical protein